MLSHIRQWFRMRAERQNFVDELGRLDRAARRDIGLESPRPAELLQQNLRDKRVLAANGLSTLIIRAGRD